MQVTPEISLTRRYDLEGHPIQLYVTVTLDGGGQRYIDLRMKTDEKGQVHHKDLAAHIIAAGEALMRFNG